MNRPYLTDWELYIVFCNYYKIQKIEMKLVLYWALLRKNQLPTWRSLPFSDTSLNLRPYLPSGASSAYYSRVAKKKPYKTFFIKSHPPFKQWLQEYLDEYRNDLLGNIISLKNTTNFIQKLDWESGESNWSINSQQITQLASIGQSAHPYEDILILLQEGYLNLNDVILENSSILDTRLTENSIPHFTLNLSVIKPLTSFTATKLSKQFSMRQNEITASTPTGISQASASSQVSQPQTNKVVIIPKINYKTDFLPYKDALVLLYLAIGNKYLITEAGMKDSLPAISKMPFLTVRDGGRKHIEKALKKYAQPIKTYELALPDKTCCIIVTDNVEFNKHIQEYATKYLNEQLENPNNYYQYGISWNMTVRWLNSLQIIHGNVYSLSPEIIKNNQDIPINKASWIECLLKLIVDKRISLSEMTLDITKSPVFKVRIRQTEQLPFQESDALEYLGIIINKNNEVWYKDKKIPLDFRSKQFIFLKYLVQLGDNYKKVTNPIEEFKNYLDKELKERGHKEPKRPTVRGIQDYASQIRIKFEKTVGTNAITFHIVAGTTGLRLQNTASTRSKKRNKRPI